MNELASKTRRSLVLRVVCAVACGILCAEVGVAAPAVGTQPLASIRDAAEAFVRSQMPAGQSDIVISAVRLDPRLRLAQCGGGLESSLLSGVRMQAQMSVAVGCRTGANWTIYVPVTVQSRIHVWALRAPQMQGARLAADDVVAETRLVGGTPVGYVTNPAQLAHATLRHPLPAGAILTADDLLADFMVRQGEQVTLVADIGGVEVRAGGLALQDGRQGALIRVENPSSARVIQGIVKSDRVVDVTP